MAFDLLQGLQAGAGESNFWRDRCQTQAQIGRGRKYEGGANLQVPRNLANACELTELVTTATDDATNITNQRIVESFDEVNTTPEKQNC